MKATHVGAQETIAGAHFGFHEINLTLIIMDINVLTFSNLSGRNW